MGFDKFESNYVEINSGSGSEEETNEAAIKEVGERLKKGEWLWHPYMVDKIKTISEGRKVVVVDVDGVLRSSRTSEDDENPIAEKVLNDLKDKGYLVVIWTSSSREWLEDKSQKFVDMADFAISNENYDRMSRSGSEVNLLRNLIKDYENYSEEERREYLRYSDSSKRVELLFDNAVLLQDGDPLGRFANRTDMDGHEVNVHVDDKNRNHYFAQINLASFSGKMSDWESKRVLGEWVVDSVDKMLRKFEED